MMSRSSVRPCGTVAKTHSVLVSVECLSAQRRRDEPRRTPVKFSAVGSIDGMDSSRFSRGRMCREETWVATTNQEEADMDATTVAVDLAKDIFQVALANRAGRVVERKRLTRAQCSRFIDGLDAGTDVIMEACGTAHDWGAVARPAVCGRACCPSSTCGRTSGETRPIGRTPKRCSKLRGVATFGRCP